MYTKVKEQLKDQIESLTMNKTELILKLEAVETELAQLNAVVTLITEKEKEG